MWNALRLGGAVGQVSPRTIYPCFLGDALGLRVTRRRRNKLINGHIERGGRKFQGYFIRHNRSQILESSKQDQTK